MNVVIPRFILEGVMMHRLAFVVAALGTALGSSAAVAASSSPITSPSGSIEAKIRAQIQGRSVSCLGALLIPRSQAADQDIIRSFGNNQRGLTLLEERDFQRLVDAERPRLPASRDGVCHPFSSTFSFQGIDPGEYYVTALVTASGDRLDQGFSAGLTRRALLMRRVTVEPGRKIKILMKD